ncbi:MAG: hypothetical protein ED555_09600 [Allomuricauda sp.]|nr:MAG: hypothetical protein ED555_09600 [Allomuricauda sp.]
MNNQNTKYERAKKRVKQLKGFYDHLKVFLVINGLFYLFRSEWFQSLLFDGFPLEPYFFDWIHANFFIWLAILVVHGLVVFAPKLQFFKGWEERQIKKYMDEEMDERDKYK